MSIFTNKKKSIPEDAVPATVEQAIPLQDIYEDGICLRVKRVEYLRIGKKHSLFILS